MPLVPRTAWSAAPTPRVPRPACLRHTASTALRHTAAAALAVALAAALALAPESPAARVPAWQGDHYAEPDWTPHGWYASPWVLGALGHNWQSTTLADGHNWQGHNWQGSSRHDHSDEQQYGESIDGSASYGAWG